MVPGQAPSSLDCNPSEYCTFEVGYFLEAHLITNNHKEKKHTCNQRIEVLGKSNAPEKFNQEFTNTFKLGGIIQMFKNNTFTVSTKLPVNMVNPGMTVPIYMEVDSRKCSEPVTNIRVGLARSVVTQKHHVNKKFKVLSEEIMFASSGSMPAN